MSRVPAALCAVVLATVSLPPSVMPAEGASGYHTVLSVTRPAKVWTSKPFYLRRPCHASTPE